MKSTFYLIIFSLSLVLSTFNNAYAQAPSWIWANRIGATDLDYGNFIKTDDSANVYTTGVYSGTVDFDPGLGTFILTSSGFYDIFISKLDVSGNFIWAKSIGGVNGFGEAYSLAVDSTGDGNILITGYFFGEIDCDPGPGIFNLTSVNGGFITFIVKLTRDGNLVWAKMIGGTVDNNFGTTINTDATGNVYAGGYFAGTADFDPGPGTNIQSSAGYFDAFVEKLDSAGNFIWVKTFGGMVDDKITSIAISTSGHLYITGSFMDVVDFDPGPGVANLTSAGNDDIFISKLHANGNFIWAKKMGDGNLDGGTSIAIDGNENIYTTGYFGDTPDFNPGTGTAYLTSSGFEDVFISKLDSAGNFLLAKAIGGPDNGDFSTSIGIDASGNIYSYGYFFSSNVDCDPGSGVYYLNNTAPNYSDVFISKFNPTGNLVWAIKLIGAENEYGQSMTVNAAGDLLATGYFFSPVLTIDSINLTNANAGSADLFITKLSSCNTASLITATSCGSYTSPSGNYTWTSSGSYIDILANATGCDSIITINLTIILVDTSVTQSGNSLLANAAGSSYQWLDCNNGFALINGATNQTFLPATTGYYAVAITQNGCTDTSFCHAVTGVGMNETPDENSLTVFPNPANDLLLISYPLSAGKAAITTITDITGKMIYIKKESNTHQIVVNTSDFANGVYLVQIQTAEFSAAKKVIIIEQ